MMVIRARVTLPRTLPGLPRPALSQIGGCRRIVVSVHAAGGKGCAEMGTSMGAMDLLDEVPAPILVVDEDGRLKFANAAAQPLIARGDLVSLKNGRLIAVGGNSRDWTAALRQATAGETALLPFTVVQRTSVTTGLVRLRRIQMALDSPPDRRGDAYLALIELRGAVEVRAACVAVAANFELTPTEMLVLRLLSEGGQPEVDRPPTQGRGGDGTQPSSKLVRKDRHEAAGRPLAVADYLKPDL